MAVKASKTKTEGIGVIRGKKCKKDPKGPSLGV